MNRRRVGEDRGSKEMDGCPLTITIFDNDQSRAQVRMGHSEPHPHYVNISIPGKIQELIADMKNSSASKVNDVQTSTDEYTYV
jgi:hypothetical protein